MPNLNDAAIPAAEPVVAACPLPNASSDDLAELPTKLLIRYAAWLRVSGQFDRALKAVNQLERRVGESAALLDEQAALALARGDLNAVRSCWERRLASHPSPTARAAYARALLELGEGDEAAAIADDLLSENGELATVRALAAEVALQQGDLATAHDFWSAQLREDGSRVAPLLAMARIGLLGGDVEVARSALDRAIPDPSALTAAQLATAAGLAEMLAQPARAQALRLRYAQLEMTRAAALAAEIDAALGREPLPTSAVHADGRAAITSTRPTLPDAVGDESGAPPEADLSSAESAEERVSQPDVVHIEEDPDDPRVLPTLHEVFGYEWLLPGQAAVINRVLAGRDTLAILPTGAGKSLTFQLPSFLLDGATLVLSPLIALMKDQVDGLPPALRERTVLINSTLSPEAQRQALDGIAAGDWTLVYAAPERLRQPSFLRALRQAGVSLVVVDEAHCISLWGHDFRPDYLSIPAALPELGNPPLLAMTATATPEAAKSLSTAFRRDLDVVRTSSFRPNLFFAGERFSSKEEKARRVVALCRETKGQGIVYVSSRRDAENLAGVLGDNGVSAVPYHAGLAPQVRAGNQDRFMRGAARVVVATVAFGMGVDKPDVRFIIHFSPSTSLEAYAQESGRAGRDGEDSRCVLLYTPSDRATQTRLARRDAMDLDTLRQVYAGIKRHAAGSWAIFEPSRIVLPLVPGDDPDERPDPRVGVGLLVEGQLLVRHPNAAIVVTLTRGQDDSDEAPLEAEDAAIWQRLVGWAGLDATASDRVTIRTAEACAALDVSPEVFARVLDEQTSWTLTEGDRLTCLELLPVAANAGERLQRVLDDAADRARRRVDRIMAYAEGRRCRHADLAAHLGERLPPCGDACDVCTGESTSAAPTRAVGERRERQPVKRTAPTAADEIVALKALASAPFPVGKTGLVRLLEGSIQSRIQRDRSVFFGALADLRKSKIGAVVDLLVDKGDLSYDRSRDFPVLRLTAAGQQRLQQIETMALSDDSEPPETPSENPLESDDSPDTDEELLQRLKVWRRERAARDDMPAFVIAHDSVLMEIARCKPSTIDDLSAIRGYGKTRAESYGAEIVAVIRKAAYQSSQDGP